MDMDDGVCLFCWKSQQRDPLRSDESINEHIFSSRLVPVSLLSHPPIDGEFYTINLDDKTTI